MITLTIILIFSGVTYFFMKKNKENPSVKQHTEERNYTIDERYNAEKVRKQKEVDRILEKISRKGMESLHADEKKLLATAVVGQPMTSSGAA